MDTILIVEDNDLEIHLFRSVLQSVGYEVLVAINGQQAVALLQECHPSLILMDIRLPGGISGWDVAHDIKAEYSLSDIPIILMTAHDFPDDKQNAIDLGCQDYLVKPINMTWLKSAVQAYIAGRTSV